MSWPSRVTASLSRRAERPERSRDLIGVAEALGLSAEVVEVPTTILDAPAWLLIMRAGEHID